MRENQGLYGSADFQHVRTLLNMTYEAAFANDFWSECDRASRFNYTLRGITEDGKTRPATSRDAVGKIQTVGKLFRTIEPVP